MVEWRVVEKTGETPLFEFVINRSAVRVRVGAPFHQQALSENIREALCYMGLVDILFYPVHVGSALSGANVVCLEEAEILENRIYLEMLLSV
jgi:hypothetical protein